MKEWEVEPESSRLWITFLMLFGVVVIGLMMYFKDFPNSTGPWYLGCADRNGKEYLLKTDKKPRVSGSIVYIGDDIFVVPEPGMTCRVASVKKIEEENANK